MVPQFTVRIAMCCLLSTGLLLAVGDQSKAQAPKPSSSSKRPVPRESARATAAKQRVRAQLAQEEQQQLLLQQQMQRQNGMFSQGNGYGAPTAWGYGGYVGYGYGPGWNAPGYGLGYTPTVAGVYQGYAPGVYPAGAVGTGTVGLTPASTAGAYPGDKFRANWGSSVNGGTYYPGQGVTGSSPLPRNPGR